MSDGPFVFIIDDEPSVCDSLIYLLDSVELVGRAFESAEAFLSTYTPTMSGCVVIDVRLPGIDGLELQNMMRSRGWTIPTVVVSAHGDIPMAVAAMRGGAFDFIEKPFDDDDLVTRIRAAIAFDRRERSRNRERDEFRKRVLSLTPRETQVLDLVVAGEPTKSIAQHLGTSFNTVQNQRASILRKMDARSVADLVRMVMISRTNGWWTAEAPQTY